LALTEDQKLDSRCALHTLFLLTRVHEFLGCLEFPCNIQSVRFLDTRQWHNRSFLGLVGLRALQGLAALRST